MCRQRPENGKHRKSARRRNGERDDRQRCRRQQAADSQTCAGKQRRQRRVQNMAALMIDMPAPEKHRQTADDIGRRAEKADRDRRIAEVVHNLREPEHQAIERHHNAEIDRAEQQHIAGEQRFQAGVGGGFGMRGAFRIKRFLQPLAFRRREPFRLRRAVGQPEVGHHAKHDRGQGLDQKQPLPGFHAADILHEFENEARYWRADHAGHRNGQHEAAQGDRAIAVRHPVGEIQHDAGNEAGFGEPQQQTQDKKARLVPGDRHQAGDDAPAQQNARDPHARAKALQHVIAGHLKRGVTEKENPGAETKDKWRQAQILVHQQGGEADVDAIKVVGDETNGQKRQQPASHFGDDPPPVDIVRR